MKLWLKPFTLITLAALTMTAFTAAPASAEPEPGERVLPAETVLLQPMVVYRSKSKPWPARADRRAAIAAASRFPLVKVKLPAQSGSARAAALGDASSKAMAIWRRQRAPRLLKTDTVIGNCGWSEIALINWGGDNIGWTARRFGLNRPGYAYRVNTHIWDTAALDFSSWDFPETGNLGGGRSYSREFTFRVDENGDYGAELNRGDVYVGGDQWCVTGRPRVDNVRII